MAAVDPPPANLQNILPYRLSSLPSVSDALQVRSGFTGHRGVPPEIARQIVSNGYNPRLQNRRDDEQHYQSTRENDPDYNIAGLYLTSDPIPLDQTSDQAPPNQTSDRALLKPSKIAKRIIFQTRAADQSWVTLGGAGTFNNSHTWFEASILRPLGHPPATKLESVLTAPFRDVQSARDALRDAGWEFVARENGDVTWRVLNNITAQRECRNYSVEWERGVETVVQDEKAMGKGEGFLELLSRGCIVALWAKAAGRFWDNRVAAATIEIEYELP
ncbi:hypothetical protein F4810DRAFT_659088 [Camillea tinctor]|nr:hypothetical protein F4810DRAFT_659088 [Camillea tinctor]